MHLYIFKSFLCLLKLATWNNEKYNEDVLKYLIHFARPTYWQIYQYSNGHDDIESEERSRDIKLRR